MADTVLESLAEEVDTAFKEFAVRPTQSARLQLRTRLRTIADALEVEANALPDDEAAMLHVAITDLKALSEVALVAPKDALIMDRDLMRQPAPEPLPIPKMGKVGKSLWMDFLSLFKVKKERGL